MGGEMGQDVARAFFQVIKRTDLVPEKYSVVLKGHQEQERAKTYRGQRETFSS
jgi:hypothetical protein